MFSIWHSCYMLCTWCCHIKMFLLSSITVWTLVFSVRRVPPHFSIPPEDVEVTPGGSVNITCVAVGSPMPYVKWRLGAIELTPEDSIPIGKNVLMLNNVLESANYTCVATSDLGNIDAVAKVKVKGSRWRSNSSLHNCQYMFIYTAAVIHVI